MGCESTVRIICAKSSWIRSRQKSEYCVRTIIRIFHSHLLFFCQLHARRFTVRENRHDLLHTARVLPRSIRTATVGRCVRHATSGDRRMDGSHGGRMPKSSGHVRSQSGVCGAFAGGGFRFGVGAASAESLSGWAGGAMQIVGGRNGDGAVCIAHDWHISIGILCVGTGRAAGWGVFGGGVDVSAGFVGAVYVGREDDRARCDCREGGRKWWKFVRELESVFIFMISTIHYESLCIYELLSNVAR